MERRAILESVFVPICRHMPCPLRMDLVQKIAHQILQQNFFFVGIMYASDLILRPVFYNETTQHFRWLTFFHSQVEILKEFLTDLGC
jgi:hypothetical protein